jgi:hypothetical protein
MKITVVHNNEESVQEYSNYHNYVLIDDIDARFKNVNLNSSDFYEQVIYGENSDATYTYVVMSLGNDEITQRVLEDITVKIRPDQELKIKKDTPLYVRYNFYTKGKNNLIYNPKTRFKIDTFDKTYKFKDEILDKRAKVLHEAYKKEAKFKVEPWNHLEFYKKDKNFAASDHEIVKLEVIKELISEYDEDKIEKAISIDKQDNNPHYKFKDLSEIQQKMVDMEHRRWNAYHYINGWIYGEKRNNDFKIHTCLVDTEELENLPQDKQDYYLNDLTSWKNAYKEYLREKNL